MALSYEIKHDEAMGRYLAASMDIHKGQIIMKAMPIHVGSRVAEKPICFKCGIHLMSNIKRPCPECKIALTCGYCDGDIHQEECAYMKKMDVPGLTFEFLQNEPQVTLALRCLLLKYYDSTAWEQFQALESHVELRRGTEIYAYHKNRVEEPLKAANILHDLGIKEEDDLISIICGVIDVNSFELRSLPGCEREDNLCGIYVKPSLMAHDCTANTLISVNNDLLMTVRACVLIKKGTMITHCYTECMDDNVTRQEALLTGKHFLCKCARCKDPTEFGTGVGTCVCPNCKKQSLHFVEGHKWECFNCEKTFNRRMVRRALECGKEAVALHIGICTSQEQKVFELQTLKRMMLKSFHDRHSLILQIESELVSALSDNYTEEGLLIRLNTCIALKNTLQVLQPGISRRQGLLEYYHQASLITLARIRFENERITLAECLAAYKEGEQLLKGAVEHLIYEPKSTPEGRLAQSAMVTLSVIRETIKSYQIRLQQEARRKK